MTNRVKFEGYKYKALVIIMSAIFALSLIPSKVYAAPASLFLIPSSGTFVIDSTFEVSIYLNTGGNQVNTIDLALRYPPDKLQLVSSGTGKSIIGLWTSQPRYNNQTGLLELTGGIPGGVNVERGLITTLTFRVKTVGSAVVKFDRTRVLLNDGSGTELLTQNQNSLYDLILPPPAGPIVVSDTHPDQTQWYRSNTVNLKWKEESGADAFSYMISDRAIDTPDEISEGNKQDIVYRNLGEGRRYFHIRALRGGSWGGTTHFALNIDTAAPAEFMIDVTPGNRTTRRQPVLQFETTDALSGMDHYEMKMISLKNPNNDQSDEIFSEVQSPYVTPELEDGGYDIIVRAYDKAGNYREVTQRVDIVPLILRYISGQGFQLRSSLLIPWWMILLLMLLIAGALFVLGRRLHIWHRHVAGRIGTGQLPNDLRQQMDELDRYRNKYGKLAVIVLLVASLFWGGSSVNAQESTREDVFDAPIITTLSKNITNEEIFYIGGLSGRANAEVILYIQNLHSAETLSETMESDKNGEWFYRHDAFLSAGNYVLWAQSKSGNQLSPPSPQVNVSVEETALQFGATKVSYATVYLVLFIVSLLLLMLLAAYIIYHMVHGHRKHRIMLKEISEAQESLRRGFAVLNRDIQAELEIIKKAKLSQKLSEEERIKEEQLLKDLSEIEQYVSKEIWDITEAEVKT
jgi:hypothetical protein